MSTIMFTVCVTLLDPLINERQVNIYHAPKTLHLRFYFARDFIIKSNNYFKMKKSCTALFCKATPRHLWYTQIQLPLIFKSEWFKVHHLLASYQTKRYGRQWCLIVFHHISFCGKQHLTDTEFCCILTYL